MVWREEYRYNSVLNREYLIRVPVLPIIGPVYILARRVKAKNPFWVGKGPFNPELCFITSKNKDRVERMPKNKQQYRMELHEQFIELQKAFK